MEEQFDPCFHLQTIINLLPKRPEEANGAWSPFGDEILCEDEETANKIADVLEMLVPGVVINTGYYSPVEDERNNEVDECTGWWSVCIG